MPIRAHGVCGLPLPARSHSTEVGWRVDGSAAAGCSRLADSPGGARPATESRGAGGPAAAGDPARRRAGASLRAAEPIDVFIRLIEQAETPAREAGVLHTLSAKEGQMVREGDVVAQIDDRPAALQRQQAELEVRIAREQADSDVSSAGPGKPRPWRPTTTSARCVPTRRIRTPSRTRRSTT